MASMTVGKRLGLGFGAVIALMIIISVLGISNMRSINSDMDTLIRDKFPKTVWANNMVDGVNAIAIAMRNSLLESAPEKIQKELGRIEEQRAVIKENLAKLEDTVKSGSGLEALKAVQDARNAYVGSQDEFLKLVKAGRQEEARVLLLERIRGEQRT